MLKLIYYWGKIALNKKEIISLQQYLYCAEERLEEVLKDCNYRYVRRELDSLDLLEEIIARERLNCFKDVSADIRHILQLNGNENV